MEVTVARNMFPLVRAFTISRGSRSHAYVLTATVTDGETAGRGECVPYARYGETLDSVASQIERVDPICRTALQEALPPGAARNAVDCALWDLEAKRLGRHVWELAGLAAPRPVVTAYTISLDTPDNMRLAAAHNSHRPILKIKLGTRDDMPRLEAVREGAPDTRIIVDANEGWTEEIYSDLAPHLVRLGVELVEQPLPAEDDAILAEIPRPLPVCADESCHDRTSLPSLYGRYDFVNIKLDKAGGLTEALALRDAAFAEGYGIMVGCMLGSSLSMAPALLVAQNAAVVDLDGPLLLAEDREVPLRYDGSEVHPPASELWG